MAQQALSAVRVCGGYSQKAGPIGTVAARFRSHEIERNVRERFAAELVETDDLTLDLEDFKSTLISTMVWSGVKHDKYNPVVIGHYIEEGFAITGIAVLRVDPSRPYNFPAETVVAVSKALLLNGDTSRVVVSR